ncbi:hypothetical protein ACFV4G_35350 [Kitasatospora sp. NPDC059747]|uniref:hypothetical protein n=1 Tax=Kitasatospora sp. NPDC059747 TaxID=3346930 RepID=UPI0036468511
MATGRTADTDHFTPPGPPHPTRPHLTDTALAALIRRHARPCDGLEHLRVRGTAHRFDVAAFVSAENAAAARTATHAICARILAESPALHGWRVAGDIPAPWIL